MKLLVATNNPEKCDELNAMLDGLDVSLLTLDDYPDAPEVVEDGETFEANARKKAAEMAVYTGLYAMADDSGLCVDALDGRPGVRSARYAGPNPTREKLCGKLLNEMGDVGEGERAAAFHCCAALSDPDGSIIFTVHGACEGEITEEMCGDGGFGYDPVFYYPPAGMTFAEMPRDEKNRVSHRARALEKFRNELENYIARKR